MTSRERVLESLNHRQPDKVPFDLGGTFCTTIHVSGVSLLRRHYGLEGLAKLAHPGNMTGIVEDDLKDAMGCDVKEMLGMYNSFGFKNENWKKWRIPQGMDILVPGDFNVTDDGNGGYYLYPQGDTSAPPSGHMPKGGFYFDSIIRQDPIDDDNLNPEDNLQEFGPISDEAIEFYIQDAKNAAATGRCVVANFGGTSIGNVANLPAPHLKHPKGIRDLQEWYISTVTRRDYLHKVFEKQTDIALENLKKLYDAVGQWVDVVFICGSDFGTQLGQMCSEQTFRELYMPYYKKMNNWVHQNTTWKTMKHSCGAIEPLMPCLIESGFDIINPVQCTAKGMDPVHLKKTYGKDIVFWGGGVDTQTVLPFGTPEEVRKQVLERCEIFSKDGGFVFSAIHCIQANTPIENIVAMVNAVHEFNGDKS
jgi:hypothetical protein